MDGVDALHQHEHDAARFAKKVLRMVGEEMGLAG